MERAKKLVLVPKEQLEKFQRKNSNEAPRELSLTVGENPLTVEPFLSPPTSSGNNALLSTQTVGDNLSRLDDAMRKILDSTGYTSEYQRVKDHLNLLRRYLYFLEEKRTPRKSDVGKEEDLAGSTSAKDELIVESVPKAYQKKARLLLNHLKANSKYIYWNNDGVVYINGDKIPGSNIVDLINDAMRHRKHVKAEGRRNFAAALHEIGIPREFVGNPELWALTGLRPKQLSGFLSHGSDSSSDKDAREKSSFLDESASFSKTVIQKKDSKKSQSGKKGKSKSFSASTPYPKRRRSDKSSENLWINL